MDEPSSTHLPSPARLSKTPSWVLLGFLIGVLFMWALPREIKKSTGPGPKPRTVMLERPKLSDIEAVFAEWGRFAVWEHDLTEVALWDVEKRDYSLYYEVLRNGEIFYFRAIPKLSRPILTHGVRVRNCPLVFTETEEMRREWEGRELGGVPAGQDRSFEWTTPADGGPE